MHLSGSRILHSRCSKVVCVQCHVYKNVTIVVTCMQRCVHVYSLSSIARIIACICIINHLRVFNKIID